MAPPVPAGAPSFGQKVWLLNLDQIESNTGVLLNRDYVDISDVGNSTFAFDSGNVLYSKLRPYLNKVYLPDASGFCTSELVPMRPNLNLVTREYLAAYLRSPTFLNWVNQQVDGAKMPRVSMKILWEHEVNLPPLEEQRRITAILEKTDSLRRKRLEAIRLADDFLRAMYIDMFGDPIRNEKGLPVFQLGDVCRFYAGNSLPAGEAFEGQLGGVLHIKVGDMNLPGNESDIYVAREWSNNAYGGIIAPAGTILIPKRGGAIATNKKRVLSRPCALDPNLMAIGPGAALRQEVLFEWFKQFDLTSITSGSAVPQLNKGDLAPLKITVPTLAMQDRFVMASRKVKSAIAKQDEQLDAIHAVCAALTSNLLAA
jgi:type I restriction enzyme S subunit